MNKCIDTRSITILVVCLLLYSKVMAMSDSITKQEYINEYKLGNKVGCNLTSDDTACELVETAADICLLGADKYMPNVFNKSTTVVFNLAVTNCVICFGKLIENGTFSAKEATKECLNQHIYSIK